MNNVNGTSERGSAVGSSTDRRCTAAGQRVACDGVDGIADCRAARHTAATEAAADSNEAVRVRPHNKRHAAAVRIRTVGAATSCHS